MFSNRRADLIHQRDPLRLAQTWRQAEPVLAVLPLLWITDDLPAPLTMAALVHALVLASESVWIDFGLEDREWDLVESHVPFRGAAGHPGNDVPPSKIRPELRKGSRIIGPAGARRTRGPAGVRYRPRLRRSRR